MVIKAGERYRNNKGLVFEILDIVPEDNGQKYVYFRDEETKLVGRCELECAEKNLIEHDNYYCGLNPIMVELGYSTQRLANETGISKRTLDHYRNGTRQMNLVNGLKIADVLGIDPHRLIVKEV